MSIEALIRASLANRGLVLVAAALLALASLVSVQGLKLDAIPDLSDTQVIVRGSWPGQAPQIIEDQLTYPLSTELLAVPKAKAVRSFSMFGDAFAYVLFEDGTDLYWARSRVLEQLGQLQGRLPAGATLELGPDATGVGWIYQYALIDRSGARDLGQLRSLQDWLLRFELQRVPGVAEVAAVGGFVKQFEAVIDPLRLQHHGLTLDQLLQALRGAHAERSGARLELAEAEYLIRGSGLIRSLDDLGAVPTGVLLEGTPLLLRDVAEIREAPMSRVGIAELDGEGEAVGGIVVMRDGENARAVIEAVKQRIEQLRPGLPAGVEIIEVYDRSQLIDRAVDNLSGKLIAELAMVALVCVLFLMHARSALVIVITLPLGVLVALAIMRWQGLSANIMSLGGIAIAIGAMVDASIVMVENTHVQLARYARQHGRPAQGPAHWKIVSESAQQVGPALFFSLLITALSFLPVFALEAQEGRMFGPLAWTKTWALLVAALLAVTLVPVLMGLLIRGRVRDESQHRITNGLSRLYAPVLDAALTHPRTVIALGLLLCVSALYPLSRLGSEFMPDLEEGDLLYMPTTLPALSPSKASELLQQTNQAIREVPEVLQVFGKAGRADSATDPAPLSMLETVVRLRPESEWRPGISRADIEAELAAIVQLPGLTNAWVPPIRNRITMQVSGIRTPLGLRVSGPDLPTLTAEADRLARVLGGVAGTRSAFADRAAQAREILITPDREALARYGLSMAELQDWIGFGIGGAAVLDAVLGRERYAVALRVAADWRDSPEALRELPIQTTSGAEIRLGQVAEVSIENGPAMILSEDARLSTYVFIDLAERDLGAWIERAERALAEQPGASGTAWAWAGSYAYLQRAAERLQLAVPLTLLIVFGLLYAAFRRFGEAALLMLTLPLALVGGLWLLWLLDYAGSVAVAVGFIALAGVAAEFGVVMLITLDSAVQDALHASRAANENLKQQLARIDAALREGALSRLRPKLMTVVTLYAGLLPMMFGHEAGAATLQRIVAPMLGGMLSAPLLSMLLLPAAYRLLLQWRLTRAAKESPQ
jgi:Cu(I)/Ag(I) efflux system membrane protein CusA/SilA